MPTYTTMYDRILVPTDGSEGVERAVDHATELAAAHGASLHAVYVVNTASYGTLPMETSWEGVADMLRDEGEAAVERVKAIADERGVPVEVALVDGTPSKEIVRYAESNDCDLVVMGTHGRGGIDRLLLGSVAERVVRSSDVPVLTVRVGEREDEVADEQGEREATGGESGSVARIEE
jgi:nucleotide-binding universal stress UspA family protein